MHLIEKILATAAGYTIAGLIVAIGCLATRHLGRR